MENKILEEFTGLTLKMITCINLSVIYVCIFFYYSVLSYIYLLLLLHSHTHIGNL